MDLVRCPLPARENVQHRLPKGKGQIGPPKAAEEETKRMRCCKQGRLRAYCRLCQKSRNPNWARDHPSERLQKTGEGE